MNLYTTYQIITDSVEEGLEDFIKVLENITGNKVLYGMNTPIYLESITDDMLYLRLLDYCYQDTRSIKKMISLELVKPFLQAWVSMTGGDTQLSDLIAAAETRLTLDTTGMTDACGDPIATVTASDSDLTARADRIQATYEAWDAVEVAEAIYTWIPVSYMHTGQGDGFTYLPETTSDTSKIGSTFSQPPAGNIDTMLANDKDAFVKLYDSVVAQNNSGHLYQKIAIVPPAPYTFNNTYRSDAAKFVARAVIIASRGGSPSLVYQLLRQSMTKWLNKLAGEACHSRLRIKECGNMVIPTPAAPVGTPEYDIESRIKNAIDLKKIELLQNPVYLHTFTPNGVISNYTTLFKDVQSQVAEVALSISNELLVNNIIEHDSLSMTLRAIIV